MDQDLHNLVAGVPHVEQYGGVWAMYEQAFQLELARVRAMNLRTHINAAGGMEAVSNATARQAAAQPKLEGEIAVLHMRGMFTKYGSSFSMNPGALLLRQSVRGLRTNEAVSAVVLVMDSPGGSTQGIDDLAAEVRELAKVKPVVGFIEDVGASAAYYIVSQATRLLANAGGLVGSIGTYMVVEDWSRFYDKNDIKVHVVRAGEMKGAGVQGTAITEAHLAEFQKVVDSINGLFMAAVEGGRKLSEAKVRELADGRIWIASEAVSRGLIDGMGTFEDALAEARRLAWTASRKAARQEHTMSETVSPPAAPAKAATIAELKAAIPDGTSDFFVQCLEQGHTLSAAKDAWSDRLRAELKSSHEKLDAAQAAAKKPGVEPLAAAPGKAATAATSGDAIADWDRRVAELTAGGKTQAAAIRQLAVEEPDLHAGYLEAYGAAHKRRKAG